MCKSIHLFQRYVKKMKSHLSDLQVLSKLQSTLSIFYMIVLVMKNSGYIYSKPIPQTHDSEN